MKKIGFDRKSTIQFMETAQPILPKSQSKLITATTGFGHGFAVTPLHAVVAMSAFVNGGHTVEPSIVRQDKKEPSQMHERGCRELLHHRYREVA